MVLQSQLPREYYEGSNKGKYQFVNLDDIINQFLVVYVGDEKIIRKCSRTDVAFYAQRGLAELSFDTFKSIKSQEILLPADLKMPLPHDYVNYTKISRVDSAGIKHRLYPTKDTSNPFAILQENDGSYDFTVLSNRLLTNYNFEETDVLRSAVDSLEQWVRIGPRNTPDGDDISITNNTLTFIHGSKQFAAQVGRPYQGSISSRVYLVHQKVDVTGLDEISISATATSAAASTGVHGAGSVRIGVTTVEPAGTNVAGTSFNANVTNPDLTYSENGYYKAALSDPTIFNLLDNNGNLSYIDFIDGTTSTQSLENIDLKDIPLDSGGKKYIYTLIISRIQEFTTLSTPSTLATNSVDNVTLSADLPTPGLQEKSESTAWSNYKSQTPAENNNDDYEDEIYWPNEGERYGLEPSHAQVNGSFYIDELKGFIHFSSNISGKTVILDYISDSLGTYTEQVVHKFAEEAMYRYILHGIASGLAYTQQIVPRLKKEKFAAIRQAKLRLSNFKLEELTQILRGKSKHIKH